MQFAHAENLWFLLSVLPMAFFLYGYWAWKKRVVKQLIDARLEPTLTRHQSARMQVARQVLVMLAVVLLTVASAQPQWGETNRPIKRTGVDVVFALDLSKSMLVADATPNRLQAAKNEIETTLRTLAGDRVGLVVFTAISFQQSPLTTDYGAIRFYLGKLKPDQMPVGGTSVGRAVIDAVELLTGRDLSNGASVDADHDAKRAQNQLIVLITDGEDHESDPKAAAEIAKENGIRIVTVGIGSAAGAKIPIIRADGSISGYKRDKEGKIVQSKLDESTLKMMAQATDGTYLHYDGVGSISDELVAYIDSLEKSEIEALLKARYKERYYFFLIPAIVCLLFAIFLGDRRRQTIAIVSVVLSISACERPFEDTLSSVDRGNAMVEKGEFDSALEAYRQAETEIPARPELHFDLGRAHLGLNDFDSAQREYARALEASDVSLQFDALNNLGLALAGKEDWKGAHESFAEALTVAIKNRNEIDAERVDQTRWNLEVSWRKFYPPCASLEDESEENDTAAEPTTIDPQAPVDYTLCGADDDWFAIPAIPGTQVSVEVNFRDVREEPDKELAFIHEPTDVQIALFDASGETVGAVDQGTNGDFDSERKSRELVRSIEKFVVTPEMVTAEQTAIKLKVSALEGLEYKYDLTITSIPPCFAMEEEFEENDDITQAAKIPGGEHQMHHCPGDEDWFAVDVEIGDAIFVDVIAQEDAEREVPPTLTVEIFDPITERAIASSISEAGLVTAGIRALRSTGSVAIRIAGTDVDQQGPYQLVVYKFPQCPIGDDRFEENDDAASAAPLDMAQPIHRYLRICDGDEDFFKLSFPDDAKDKSVKMGLSLVSDPRDGEVFDGEFSLDVVSSSGDQILAEGQALATPDPEAVLPLHRAVISEPVEDGQAVLRVGRGNDFYHLVQLNPQQPPDDQQSEEEKEKNEDKSEEQEEQESEDDKDSEKSEDDENKEEQDASPQEEESEEESEEQQAQPTDSTETEDPEKARVEDLLEALEQSDDNFQLRKALEDIPNRYIPKDW